MNSERVSGVAVARVALRFFFQTAVYQVLVNGVAKAAKELWEDDAYHLERIKRYLANANPACSECGHKRWHVDESFGYPRMACGKCNTEWGFGLPKEKR